MCWAFICISFHLHRCRFRSDIRKSAAAEPRLTKPRKEPHGDVSASCRHARFCFDLRLFPTITAAPTKLTGFTEKLLLHVSRAVFARFDGHTDAFPALRTHKHISIQTLCPHVLSVLLWELFGCGEKEFHPVSGLVFFFSGLHKTIWVLKFLKSSLECSIIKTWIKSCSTAFRSGWCLDQRLCFWMMLHPRSWSSLTQWVD